MRLLYFQQNIACGATEEYLYLLMDGIDKNEFKVNFLCPKEETLGPLVHKVEKLGIKVNRYSIGSGGIGLIRRLRRSFLILKPDIIHFNDPCLYGIIAALLAGTSNLVMTHHTPELNRRYNWKGGILERITLRYCGLNVIFTSEYDRETGVKRDKIPKNKTYVVYYGLPPERFTQRHNKKEVYDEFHLDQRCRLIANIARLSAQKGQRHLIEVASLVIKEYDCARFFFVGEGELKDELKAMVRDKGLEDYFIFTGYRSDIPRLLSAFEVLVMPSLFEGLCFAVIEASAMGVAVIASNVGGMRRSVADGKTGILVPPADPGALARAILWMLGHPKEAEDMGAAGKRHFAQLFTQKRMVDNTEALYKSFHITL